MTLFQCRLSLRYCWHGLTRLGRANTQVRPYENDTAGRVKLVGADLCVCPDCRRLSDDTHKNKPDEYVIMH